MCQVKRDPIAMMKALKQKENAARAAAGSTSPAAKAESSKASGHQAARTDSSKVNVEEGDAGIFGKVKSGKGSAVLEYLRRKQEAEAAAEEDGVDSSSHGEYVLDRQPRRTMYMEKAYRQHEYASCARVSTRILGKTMRGAVKD